MKTNQESQDWFDNLSNRQQCKVLKWLVKNKPPKDWKYSTIAYAYLEMSLFALWF